MRSAPTNTAAPRQTGNRLLSLCATSRRCDAPVTVPTLTALCASGESDPRNAAKLRVMATQSATYPASGPTSAGLLLPAFTLWWRELVRFYRQRARVVGVIASPLLFWIVIRSGFGSSFRSGGAAGQQHYLDYFYPGALIIIVLFTSIFTMMSVIEDRQER